MYLTMLDFANRFSFLLENHHFIAHVLAAYLARLASSKHLQTINFQGNAWKTGMPGREHQLIKDTNSKARGHIAKSMHTTQLKTCTI